MNVDQIYLLYMALMLSALALSIFRWKWLSRSDKWIAVLLCATFTSESLAYYFRFRFANNMYVYHFFNPVELALIAFYFNEAVPFLKKYRIGPVIGCLGIVAAILNAVYLQPPDTFPSIFLVFEGFCILILSLLSFYSIVYKDDVRIVRNVQFWLSFLFLVFWSFTFFIWGSYMAFANVMQDKLSLIYGMLTIINFILYSGYLTIFLLYRKMIPSGE